MRVAQTSVEKDTSILPLGVFSLRKLVHKPKSFLVSGAVASSGIVCLSLL
jgi:hypothetical protein